MDIRTREQVMNYIFDSMNISKSNTNICSQRLTAGRNGLGTLSLVLSNNDEYIIEVKLKENNKGCEK